MPYRPVLVLLSWRNSEETCNCIESLTSATNCPPILVVDNESTEASWSFLQQHAAKDSSVHLFRTSENLGYASGMNYGIQKALELHKPTHVMLFNNDVSVGPELFLEIEKSVSEYTPDILGCTILRADGTFDFVGALWPQLLFSNFLKSPADTDREVDMVEGSAMVLSSSLLTKRQHELGYYLDDEFFMYCEDAEICVWTKKNKGTVRLSKGAKIIHKKSLATGHQSPTKFFYLTRNRIRLSQYLGPWRGPFIAYYVMSRSLLIFTRYLFRPKIRLAVLEALNCGLSGRYGKWEKHDQFVG